MSADEFAQRVNDRADELGLKPVDLAAATRVHQSAAERWLKGLTKPHADHIEPLAKTLDVSIAWLLTGQEQPYDDDTLLAIYAVIEPAERIAHRYLAKKRLSRAEILDLREALDAAHAARQMLGMPEASELDAKLAHRLAQLRAERAALREIAEAEALDPLEEEEAPRGDGEDDPDAPQDGQPPEQAAE